MAKLDSYPVGVPVSGDLFPISRHGKTLSIDFDDLLNLQPNPSIKVFMFDPTAVR